MISRRLFLGGLAASIAAPAIIKTPGLLMPVRSLDRWPWSFNEKERLRLFKRAQIKDTSKLQELLNERKIIDYLVVCDSTNNPPSRDLVREGIGIDIYWRQTHSLNYYWTSEIRTISYINSAII